MQKVKVGISMEDSSYRDRLVCYLMNHYMEKLELYIFQGMDQMLARQKEVELLLMDYEKVEGIRRPAVCLSDGVGDYDYEDESVTVIEKYQDVNSIVEEILRHVGGEVKMLKKEGNLNNGTRVIAVYSLADNQYQLPFSMTMNSILGEDSKVLLLDLQENSGLARMADRVGGQGLEDLLVMAESGSYSNNRISACIGHMDKGDYVYPIANTESLCEIDDKLCNSLIQMLCSELEYDAIILNMGVRFKGFIDVLNRCNDIYLVQRYGGLSQWREYEFMQELVDRGYQNVASRIRKIEPPIITSPAISCERLVEQWKWNDFGDVIRGLAQGVACAG